MWSQHSFLRIEQAGPAPPLHIVSAADLPSPLDGSGRLLPRGAAALSAAVLRRLAPWQRTQECEDENTSPDDDIEKMLAHDAAEVRLRIPVLLFADTFGSRLAFGVSLR